MNDSTSRTSDDRKPKGWFSRKHQTNEAHLDASIAYGTRRERKEARQEQATLNESLRAAQSPQQRLDVLDQRLGAGKGAKRERARLVAAL